MLNGQGARWPSDTNDVGDGVSCYADVRVFDVPVALWEAVENENISGRLAYDGILTIFSIIVDHWIQYHDYDDWHMLVFDALYRALEGDVSESAEDTNVWLTLDDLSEISETIMNYHGPLDASLHHVFDDAIAKTEDTFSCDLRIGRSRHGEPYLVVRIEYE